MTQEEKAKAYDEALDKIKPLYEQAKKDGNPIWSTYEYLIPELAESEDKDERIRKELILHLEELRDWKVDTMSPIRVSCHYDRWIAWLEKQKAAETPQWMIDFLKEMRPYSINKEEYEGYAGRIEFESKILTIIKWLEGNPIQQKEQKPVHTAKEMWKEMRLEVYAQASGNRHEPNCSDDSTKMFSLCDIDEIFEKIGNSTVGSQPAGWSEDDERRRDGIIQWLRNYQKEFNPEYDSLSIESIESLIAWLKSLQPQAKQEWSKEEQTIIEGACNALEIHGHSKLANKLKSLRPQSHTVSIKDATKFGNLEYERGVKDGIQHAENHRWKPSEEQMEALSETIAFAPDTFKPKCTLVTLQEDLKKLM